MRVVKYIICHHQIAPKLDTYIPRQTWANYPYDLDSPKIMAKLHHNIIIQIQSALKQMEVFKDFSDA